MSYFWPILLILTLISAILTGVVWWVGRTTREPVLWNVRLDSAPFLGENQLKGSPIALNLSSNFPKRMYVQNSEIINLYGEAIWQSKVVPDFPRDLEIQVELIGPRFDIDGDKQQTRKVPHDHFQMTFTWGIGPKLSGDQKLVCVISCFDGSQWYEVTSREYPVRVDEVLKLSPGQLKVLKILGSILTILLAVSTLCVSTAGVVVNALK
jgi:hypothetical protein